MAGWEALVLTAAFMSVMVAALLIMIARFLDFKMLEQSAKSELLFAISSVVVALFLIILLTYGSQVGKAVAREMYKYTYEKTGYLNYKDANGVPVPLDPTTFDNPDYSMIEISILYMKSVMYCAEDMGRMTFLVSMPVHWLTSISQDVFMAYPMSGWAWGGVAQSMDNLLNTLYFTELIYHLQVYVLRFMDVFALNFILPIGILMRAFPPTRGAGAFVISFAVAIYLVYPFSFLAAAFSTTYPTLCLTPDIPAPDLSNTADRGSLWSLMLWYNAFEHNIIELVTNFSDFINSLLTNLCLLPMLALTVTMTFAQASNGLFGANVPEIGRGLIKLI
ncbi:MAG: hypothetical protein PHS02_00815 [Candidatus ainarchaeum sp.]|nr:hypothetical protein [Candidatus ainarchaeum sp.]